MADRAGARKFKIHFIWTGGEFKFQYYISILSAIKTQQADVVLWTSNASKNDSIDKLGITVNLIQIPQFRALRNKESGFLLPHIKDYLTYKILCENGGTCLDLDTICISDITTMIGDKDLMIPVETDQPDTWHNAYNSAILSGKKGSPVLKEALDMATEILNKDDIVWGETGPGLISDIVRKYKDQVVIAPFMMCGGIGSDRAESLYSDIPINPVVKVVHLFAHGCKKFYDQIDQHYIDTSESQVARYIRKVLQPRMFVEIGSNCFETLDYLADDGWQGLIIEPVPEYFNKLEKKENVIYENVAIGDKVGNELFYFIPEKTIKQLQLPDWARGLGSFGEHPDIVGSGWQGLVNTISVPVVPIKELLRKHNIKKIDYLKLDTEGYDYRILMDMDLSDIKTVQFEHKHCTPTEIANLKEKLNNRTFTYNGDNIVAEKQKIYRFHLLGLGHLPVSERYMGCAYTQKVVKLSKMLLSMGHEVYLYGVENSDTPCTEFVQICSLKEIRDAYGEGDNRFEIGYDWHKKMFKHDWNKPPSSATKIFYENAIKEINKRKKDDDFLLCTMGNWNKPIADGVNLFLTCEPGIGYTGSWTKYRAFESSYMQNFTYGKYSTVDSPSGNNYDVVVPNYFNIADFKFQEKKGDYFLYIGRMIVRKGILTAVEVCKKLGAKLILAGQGGRVENGIFYGEDFNTPMLPNMEYVGYADKERRSELMGSAKACFVCTDYLEPFGGVSIESLLCGTPVITTNYGCFVETIPHGEVGYRCQTLDQFVWAAKNIDKISPKRCREYAEKNYSTERVSLKYKEWFDSLYHLYLSARGAENEGWYNISDRDNLDWQVRY